MPSRLMVKAMREASERGLTLRCKGSKARLWDVEVEPPAGHWFPVYQCHTLVAWSGSSDYPTEAHVIWTAVLDTLAHAEHEPCPIPDCDICQD